MSPPSPWGTGHIWPKHGANPKMQPEQGEKFPRCFLLVALCR